MSGRQPEAYHGEPDDHRGLKTSHRGWCQGGGEDASSQPQSAHSLG
jgi:hypothetical protein